MSKPAPKGLDIAYIVVAVLTAALMFLAARLKPAEGVMTAGY